MVNGVGTSSSSVGSRRESVVSVDRSTASGSSRLDDVEFVQNSGPSSPLRPSPRLRVVLSEVENSVQGHIEQSCRSLGEDGQVLRDKVIDFIEGERSTTGPCKELIERARQLSAEGDQSIEPRVNRMHAILQAGLELFESTKGPALNLLNVVGRTAAIVVFSEVLSQIAGYYAQLAVDQGDTPEALKTWGALALGVVGPALALLGGIRNDRNGTSSTSSNVARLLMFLLTSALLIAGFVTNTLPKVFAPLAGGAVYTLVRGLLNACFPLVDKTGSPSAKAIAVTTVTYAVAQGLLDKLGQLTPLAGAARAAAGLGWSLGADAIKGLLNGFGMALDDIVYLYSKHMLPGVKPAEEEDLWVRVAPHVPSASDLADAAGNIGSMRLCAVVSFNVGLATIDSLLKSVDDEKDTRWYVLTACFAILALMIYPLLVKGSASGKDDKQPLNESPIL